MKAKINKLIEAFDSHRYTHRPDTFQFEVDVKRHGDYIDIKAIINEYPENIREALKVEFDDSNINSLYDLWLEDCRNYLIEYLGGCANNSPAYYIKLIQDIKDGKATYYPTIESLDAIEAKVAEVTKRAADDKHALWCFSLINPNSFGFYGRSGGHFCFTDHVYMQSRLDQLYNDYYEFETLLENGESNIDSDFFKNYINILSDYDTLKKEYEGIVWVMNEIEKYNDGLDFKAHVKDHIDEFISELKYKAA